MKKFITVQEIEHLSEALIQDFNRKKHYRNSFCVDIESFVQEYLNMHIVYETLAEEDPDRIGFLSDGKRPLRIRKQGSVREVLFPAGTIVIDRYLQNPSENARRRFTIAHEAGHELLNRHVPIQNDPAAAFHSEFDKEVCSNQEMLRELTTVNEYLANRTAACLLMPYFIMVGALKKYNAAQKVILYEENILAQQEKLLIQKMADAMGVSYSACFYRLKELNLFDERPIEEYFHEKICCGGTI